ncbi:hypothetical protein REPUB_Repub03eG0087800 [Reevesia pubescens]
MVRMESVQLENSQQDPSTIKGLVLDLFKIHFDAGTMPWHIGFPQRHFFYLQGSNCLRHNLFVYGVKLLLRALPTYCCYALGFSIYNFLSYSGGDLVDVFFLLSTLDSFSAWILISWDLIKCGGFHAVRQLFGLFGILGMRLCLIIRRGRSTSYYSCLNIDFSRGLKLLGFLKFNVVGASKGNPATAGCGGVLRDNSSTIISLFYGPIGFHDTNVAEIIAIKIALNVFVISKSFSKGHLLIESDSMVAVKWCKKLDLRPWRLWDAFMSIDYVL